jgi:uncharacterized protein YjbJ (UPF0337 family)
MAERTTRAKGRAKEAAGALADHKKMKDKGRLDQGKGSIKKRTRKARKKVR